MATALRIENFSPVNLKQTTTLSNQIAAGVQALPIVSNQGIAVGDFAFLGRLGSETCEKVYITGSTTNSLSTQAVTKFLHTQDEPVTAIYGDQISVYSAPNVDGTLPLDSAFTLVGFIQINPDTQYTDYSDPLGSAALWYKYTYQHSLTQIQTDIANSLATRGGAYGHYCTIDDIRTEAGFTRNQNITDAKIDVERNRAESQINAELFQVYNLPFAQPVPWLVNQIATKLAAGYLMKAEYGVFAHGTSKDGDDRIKDAETLLMAVKSREQVLTDGTGASLLVSQAISSYPNATTDLCDAPQAFTRSQVY